VTGQADVAPNQGTFLAIIAKIAGARRVLEFGTLAGYSAIWLARAVGPEGRVIMLEIDKRAAVIARRNFQNAGVAGSVELILGPAAEAADGRPEGLGWVLDRHRDILIRPLTKPNGRSRTASGRI
jgi:predicted O-methyltransferase YrrM